MSWWKRKRAPVELPMTVSVVEKEEKEEGEDEKRPVKAADSGAAPEGRKAKSRLNVVEDCKEPEAKNCCAPRGSLCRDEER